MLTGFRLIAHRGASAHSPENTLASFRNAIRLGSREVELDVRFSSDGRVVVFHDDRLDTKTTLSGRVSHHSSDWLQRANLWPWFEGRVPLQIGEFPVDRMRADSVERPEETCIPLLETVFDRLGAEVDYHIELKGWDDSLPLAVIRAVNAFGLRDSVTLTSFSLRPLREVRKLEPNIPITFLIRDGHDALRSSEFRPELEGRSLDEVHAFWLAEAARFGFEWVAIRAKDLSHETVTQARRLGLEIRCWGIRNPTDLQHAVQAGAIGATVDWPEIARKLMLNSFVPEGDC
ncbi:MAG: hypothetical protein CBC48_19250 [bacterium TMED88]|nr:hypothetical protein [Deltaproteobacteria bacterium]OUV23098.1 MAG: hypothetical protein CBC48_19250 [bacterium TMED88]